MNSKVHIAKEDLLLHAMGNLQDEDRDEVRWHLRVCAECREELRNIAGDMAALAMSVEQRPVPERVRGDLLKRIEREARQE